MLQEEEKKELEHDLSYAFDSDDEKANEISPEKDAKQQEELEQIRRQFKEKIKKRKENEKKEKQNEKKRKNEAQDKQKKKKRKKNKQTQKNSLLNYFSKQK